MAKTITDELKAQVARLKEKNLLPWGAAKKAAQLVIDKAAAEGREVKCTVNMVHQVMAGNNARLDIIEALVELAEESKTKKLLDRLKKLTQEDNESP